MQPISAKAVRARVRLYSRAFLLVGGALLSSPACDNTGGGAKGQVISPGTASDAALEQDAKHSRDASRDANVPERDAHVADAEAPTRDASTPHEPDAGGFDITLGAPTIMEPRVDGQLVNPDDVHMEIAPFQPRGPSEEHVCTDWEIWSAQPNERVWVTSCIGGLERVHTHLGDGAFEGSLRGQRALRPATDYVLRVRWHVGTGEQEDTFGPYAERRFHTRTPPAPQPGAPEWLVTQEGLVVEEIASGFLLPVNIAFAPTPPRTPLDPLFYVVELYGNIKVVTSDLQVLDYATNLLNYDPTGNFPGSGEQGLSGIAVEPSTGDLFVGMLYDDGGAHYPKLVRLHTSDDGLAMVGQTTLLDMHGELQGQSHQISNISLGPDGKLYVHMGDGLEVATARDLRSFRGKILRVELDGSAPEDNPFFDRSDGIDARDYVFAYGFRNPFGGAWHLREPALYTVENGPGVDRFARVFAGNDYGWDGTDESMATLALYNWPRPVAPVNVAFVEPDVFHGSGFPAEKMGHAFVTESGPTYSPGPQIKRLSEFAFHANGEVTGPPVSLVEYQGSGFATFAALAAGPDGLYFSDLYRADGVGGPTARGAHIYRVRYVGSAP